MNFHFNEEEQEILNMLHDYAVKEVAPRAHEIDEEEKFPMEARNGLAEMGMMGMYFPEEYGGAGLSYLSYIAVCEELAVHCATTSVVLSAHESLCSWPIYKYGTEEKKKKKLTAAERKLMIEQLTKEMKAAAKLLEFEHAAFLRDKIKQLEGQK